VSTNTLTDRIREEFLKMSRSIRMVAVVGVAVLLFLLWSATISPLAAYWGDQSDMIVAQVERIEDATAAASAQRAAVIAFGSMSSPERRASESQAMLEAITQVMSDSGIRKYVLTESSSAVKVGGTALPGIERIKATVSFSADDEIAYEAIGALENTPLLEGITSARIKRGKAGGRSLDIELALEAWINERSRR
jgi:hypothetical protein